MDFFSLLFSPLLLFEQQFGGFIGLAWASGGRAELTRQVYDLSL